MSLSDLVIELPKIADPRGNLTFIEGTCGERNGHIPFPIRRVYYLYDVPGGESRGGHAHRRCASFIVAASGSFEVLLDDGRDRRTIFLNRSYRGVLVPIMTWRELQNFSSGSVCLVLASEPYDADDYYYDYREFVRDVRGTP